MRKKRDRINLKEKFINSDHFRDFVTSNGFVVNLEFINKEFTDEILNAVKPYLDKVDGITFEGLTKVFSAFL